jgi:hypothetical protein
MTRGRRALLLALLAGAAIPAAPAAAQDLCLTAETPTPTAPPRPIRFGITPQLAGTAGAAQGEVAPEDPRARDRALERLRPPRRSLVVRLNRLFMSEGEAAIERFARRARRYARRGFLVESQIRYHPAPAEEGDMRAWRRFVRRATRALAANRALVALSITNEVNLPLSENTSDGAFERAREAITAGIPAADRVLRRLGRRDVELGFTYAYRYLPNADLGFWRAIAADSTERFHRALDYVGVQLYPGLFWPPVLLTETAGEATLEALALVRDCYMPEAGLGDGVELWVSEIGFATNLGHSEARQAAELAETVAAVSALSRTLGITELRYFNLRDNRPNGTDLFDNVGLLRPDYGAKPAFETYHEAIAEYGARDRYDPAPTRRRGQPRPQGEHRAR